MNLQQAFEEAVANSKNIPKKPSNDILLKIYALYKQGTEGDVNGKKPSAFDFVKKAKYDAWAKIQGKSQDEAQQEYVDLINGLLG